MYPWTILRVYSGVISADLSHYEPILISGFSLEVDFPVCVYARVHARARSVMSDLATAWTVACQAPLSMGFSRQEYWSELLFPPPGDLPYPGIEPGSPSFLPLYHLTFLGPAYWMQVIGNCCCQINIYLGGGGRNGLTLDSVDSSNVKHGKEVHNWSYVMYDVCIDMYKCIYLHMYIFAVIKPHVQTAVYKKYKLQGCTVQHRE